MKSVGSEVVCAMKKKMFHTDQALGNLGQRGTIVL